MPPKSEADTHVNVRVICPHCKATGKVDASRMDQSFTCGVCKKAFHVDVTQTRKGIRTEKPQDTDPAKFKADNDKPSWIGKRIGKLPRSLKIAVLAGLSLFGLWYLVYDVMVPGVPLPESLEERAVMVIKAVIEDDVKSAQRFTHDANFVDTRSWMKKVRPVSWPKKIPENATFKASLTSNARHRDPIKSGIQKMASINVHVKMPVSQMEPEVIFSTFWNQTTEGLEWRMDVKRTIQNTISSKQ